MGLSVCGLALRRVTSSQVPPAPRGPQARGDSCAPQTHGSRQAQRGIMCEESFPLSWPLSLETAVTYLVTALLARPPLPAPEWAPHASNAPSGELARQLCPVVDAAAFLAFTFFFFLKIPIPNFPPNFYQKAQSHKPSPTKA